MLKIHQRMGLITTIPLIDLLPCFRTKLSMICAKEKGKRVCRRAGTRKRR